MQIGDKIYVVEQDFNHAILFLQIAHTGEKNRYSVQLSLKSPFSSAANDFLQKGGQPLLKEAVILEIPDLLFRQAEHFQQSRRGTEEIYRQIHHRQNTPLQRENRLSAMIYDHFFKAEIGAVVRDFIVLLQKRKISELVLAVASEDAAVRQLPWEMVIEKCFTPIDSRRQHLANDNFSLIRTLESSLEGFNMAAAKTDFAPLKLLFITALPENLSEHNKMLEIEDEQRKLIEAIGEYEATGTKQSKIVIEFIDTASLGEINEALKNRKHDIVHISGHGSFDKAVKQGILYLENEDGEEERVTGAALGEMLRGHNCIKLLMLSACETAVAGEKDVTEQLVGSGIPTIVGMRFTVTDLGAKQFTNAFYGALAKGRSITQALSAGREKLWEAVEEKRNANPNIAALYPAEWFTPVVYQNQYTENLIKADGFNTETYNRFYPKISFIKGKYSRLIGEGFIGRKSYRIQLRKALKTHQHACLHGLGGLGKTALAEAFAHNYHQRFGYASMIFRGKHEINEAAILENLLDSYKETNPKETVYKKIKALIESDAPFTEKLDVLFANYLSKNKTILIFDNVEDIQTLDGTHRFSSPALRAFITYMVENAPQSCHLLFTTRYPLTDIQHKVKHINLDTMTYAEQYRYMNLSPNLSTIKQADRADIYKRINGHPRAMEYLETLIKKKGVQDWQNLNASVDEVATDIFENLILAKIYTYLSDAERILLAQTSVLLSRSPIAALAAMTEQPETDLRPTLNALRDWSLVYIEDDTVAMHNLTKEWLEQQGFLATETRKNLAYKAGQYFYEQGTLDDVLLAKDYYETAEAWEKFANATHDIQSHYQLIGLNQQALELILYALEKDLDIKSRGLLYNGLGLIYQTFGQLDIALEFYTKSLKIDQQIGDRQGEGATLNNISQIYQVKGDYDTALVFLKQSLEIHQQIGDIAGMATTLHNMGTMLFEQNKLQEATPLLMQAYGIFDKIGSPNVQAPIGYLGAIIEKVGEAKFQSWLAKG